MTYKHALVFGAVLAVCAASPALGKKNGPIVVRADSDVISRHISYADLNLASQPGERALVRRVNYAIEDLCTEAMGGAGSPYPFNPLKMQCTSAAQQQAKPQIARAVTRAREIASTGFSALPVVALTINLPK